MHLKRYTAIWLVLSVLWFLAVWFSDSNMLLLVLMIVYIVFVILKEIPRKSLVIPRLIILSLVFQNTIVGFAAHLSGISNNNLNIFTQVTFLIIVLSSSMIFFKELSKKRHFLFYIYLIMVTFFCIKGNVRNISVLLYNIRNLIAFYLLYTIGRYCIDSREKFNEIKDFYVNLAVFTGVFGMIALLIGPSIYYFFGVKEIYLVKTMNDASGWINGLPGNFNGDFFGRYLTRMGSFFLEPVNLSSYFSLAVILAFCGLNKKRGRIKFFFLVICNVLTFGKGGLLICLLTVGSIMIGRSLLQFKRIGASSMRKIVKWGIILSGVLLGIFYGTYFSYNYHFYAIKTTYSFLMKNPLGLGVGTVGNVSYAGNVASNVAIGAETGLLNIGCQLGIIGMIVFIALVFKMSAQALKNWNYDDLENYRIAFLFLPIILVIVFFFQENTFTIQVISGFMLLQGFFGRLGKMEVIKGTEGVVKR